MDDYKGSDGEIIPGKTFSGNIRNIGYPRKLLI